MQGVDVANQTSSAEDGALTRELLMELNLTPLENAVARLGEGLQRYQLDVSDSQIRDGLIQRFEFSYEIAHKMLKRYLIATSPTPEHYEQMPFSDLIRSGNEQALLRSDWPVWRGYRDMRSRTSHTYDEAVALQVVSGIPDFLIEAEYLLAQLRKRAA